MKQFYKKDFTSYNLGVILKMKNIKQLICKILCVVEIPAQKKKRADTVILKKKKMSY